jgi:hypothetical protein
MKNYGLYTKGKERVEEVIHRIKAETLEEAIALFSKVKKLSKRSIVEIFDVKEIAK